MKTINEFIQELQAISTNKRELPLVIRCPNGELASPSIKMLWDNPAEILDHAPDKMIITF